LIKKYDVSLKVFFRRGDSLLVEDWSGSMGGEAEGEESRRLRFGPQPSDLSAQADLPFLSSCDLLQTGKFTPYLASLKVGDKVAFKVRFELYLLHLFLVAAELTIVLSRRLFPFSRDLSPSSLTSPLRLSRVSLSLEDQVSLPCTNLSTTL